MNMFFSMIRGPDQWTAFDHTESFLDGSFPIFNEDFRFDKLDYFKMVSRWLKILPDCQDFTARFKEVIHRFKYLFFSFPQAYHNP